MSRISILEFRALRKGFTLIEIMLYVAIVNLLLFTVGISSQAFLEARVKNQAVAEVNHQGASALNAILQTIRNADSITLPSSGSSNELTLDVADASKDPTLFRLDSQKIQIKEGAGAWTDMTDSGKVLISVQSGDSGIFSNFSIAGTPGIIRVRFTIEYNDPTSGGRYYQQYSKDFQGAAALR